MKNKRYFVDGSIDSPGTSLIQKEQQPILTEGSSLNRTFPSKRHGSKKDEAEDEVSAPIDPAILKKYAVGQKLDRNKGIRTSYFKDKYARQQQRVDFGMETAARSEILLAESRGLVEADPGELTSSVTQKDISRAVDIASASKHFDLDLPKFGPYRIDYTRNGRHFVMGGEQGHVACFDWISKKLHCEFNVMEQVRDVQCLHVEHMFAVAQKKWTFVYDNQGVELHCLKQLHQVNRLEFLPYHFLLVGCTDTSFLHWLDITVGQIVKSMPIKMGKLDVMTQNPSNATTIIGNTKGCVTMWSPSVPEPLVKMLCHPTPVRGVAINNNGLYMATTGADRSLRIWDLRMYRQLYNYRLPVGLSQISFSQTGLLAACIGSQVQIFKDSLVKEIDGPYLQHSIASPYQTNGCVISDVRFCPFEDVLAIGHREGLSSLLVPGAGEPNIDAMEANPFQSKNQRREFEVKAMLDKIQPELINIDTRQILDIDEPTLSEKLEEKRKILYVKPQKVLFSARHRTKAKLSAAKRKMIKQETKKKGEITKHNEASDIFNNSEVQQEKKKKVKKTVLDRFEKL